MNVPRPTPNFQRSTGPSVPGWTLGAARSRLAANRYSALLVALTFALSPLARAYAFEQATQARVTPLTTPALPGESFTY